MRAVLRDVADGALLVEYPEASEEEANRRAAAAGRRLAKRRVKGFLDAIPAARTLLVLFDPLRLRRALLERQILAAGDEKSASDLERRLFRIPVRYGGETAWDLDSLARGLGISPEEFARRHWEAQYRVAFVGFAPGFPYLLGLPRELASPRLERPRTRVPAGSVAIGGAYAGVYPSESPGGWRLIGRTPASLFDASADPPALLRPGDQVLFEPIGQEEFARAWEAQRKPSRPSLSAREPVLRILSAGLCTSVQGGPVYGLGSSGVPPGGAMDLEALACGNRLLGNRPDAEALEITLSGPEIEFLTEAYASVAGADLEPLLNGHAIPPEEPFRARAGERLRFGFARRLSRAYLCLAGGLEQPSRPGDPLRRLEAGDLLGLAVPSKKKTTAARFFAGSSRREEPAVLRVVLGPQEDCFSKRGIKVFLGSEYRVSPESDRRGIRLEGERVEAIRAPEIPPEGTAPGAIQVPGTGLPIVLGPDRPVTGGYAKIATVVGADLPLLAQARPGDRLRFRAVTIDEALEVRRVSMGSR